MQMSQICVVRVINEHEVIFTVCATPTLDRCHEHEGTGLGGVQPLQHPTGILDL